jgi:hypothetical protein
MGEYVLFEVVDLQLLIVAQIAQRESRLASALPRDRELLAEMGSRDERGGNDVVVVVAQSKDLVVD